MRTHLKYRRILGLSRIGSDVFLPITEPVNWRKVERSLKAKLVVCWLRSGVRVWRIA